MSDDSPVAILYDSNGNPVTVTSGAISVSNYDSQGGAQYNFPDGFVKTSDEAHQLFWDGFDSTLDTTNRWLTPTTSGGGVAAVTSGGNVTLGSGTTANGYSYLTSQPSFTSTAPGYLAYSAVIALENPVQTNASRFWGAGISPATPGVATQLTNGFGYEVDIAGKMYAVFYSNSIRTVVQDMSAATGNSTQPTDALFHRYSISYKTDRVYWFVDGVSNMVATTSFLGPAIQTLPFKLSVVANSTAPAASRIINCAATTVGDTGKNNITISDGTFAWRRVTVDAKGNQQTKVISTTPTSTNVSVSATNVTLLATNTNRLGATIFNDSLITMVVKLGVTSSLTSYTVQILSNGYYEVPFGYVGQIDALWATSGSGAARMTELV